VGDERPLRIPVVGRDSHFVVRNDSEEAANKVPLWKRRGFGNAGMSPEAKN